MFGGISGLIIASLGLDIAWDTLASGEWVGAFVVMVFVALPGAGMVGGIMWAMYREDRDREDRESRECVGGWHCWCPACTEYRTGIDLPE
jgi:hypothetical protein